MSEDFEKRCAEFVAGLQALTERFGVAVNAYNVPVVDSPGGAEYEMHMIAGADVGMGILSRKTKGLAK